MPSHRKPSNGIRIKEECERDDIGLSQDLELIQLAGTPCLETELNMNGKAPAITKGASQGSSGRKEAEIALMFALFESKRGHNFESQVLKSSSSQKERSLDRIPTVDHEPKRRYSPEISKEDYDEFSERKDTPEISTASLDLVIRAIEELEIREEERCQTICEKVGVSSLISQKLDDVLRKQGNFEADLRLVQDHILNDVKNSEEHTRNTMKNLISELETRQKIFEQKFIWDLKYHNFISNIATGERCHCCPVFCPEEKTVHKSRKNLVQDLENRSKWAEDYSKNNIINLNELYDCIKDYFKTFTYDDVKLIVTDQCWEELIQFERLELFFEWLCELTDAKTVVVCHSSQNMHYCSLSIPDRDLHYSGNSDSSRYHSFLVACLSLLNGNFFRTAIVEILFLHHQQRQSQDN